MTISLENSGTKHAFSLKEILSKRVRPSKYPVSPSKIDQITTCPAKAALSSLSTSSYDAFVDLSANAHGTAVHKAIEDGLGFLLDKTKSGRFPGKDQVAHMLRRSFAVAEASLEGGLPIAGSTMNRMKRYTKAVIEDYGRQYLEATGGMALDVELPVNTLSLPTPSQAGGFADLVISQTRKDIIDVIDFKWAKASASDIGADYISAIKRDPSKQIQPKIYALALFDQFPEAEMIRFKYDVYWDIEKGKRARTREKIEHTFSRSDLTDLRAEISDKVATVTAHERSLASALNNERGKDVLRIISQVKRGACDPHACATCPLRYQCSFRNFVEETRLAARGETFVDRELNKLKHLENEEKVKEMSDAHTRHINEKTKMYREERLKELITKYDYNRETAELVADANAEDFRNSMESARVLRRGQFVDQMKLGAIAARSKLPVSILSPEAPAEWMSQRLRRNMYNYSLEHVERLSKSFDVNYDLAKDMIIDNVYKDRELAAHLHKSMVDGTIKNLKTMGVSLAKEGKYTADIANDVAFALKQYHKTIDRNMALSVQGALDTEFVRFVMTMDQKKLEPFLGKLKGKNLESIVKGLVDKGVIQRDPGAFLNQVAQSETFGSIMERTRLGSPKFPVGTAVIAGMLSYISGANSVRETIENKYEKLKFYLSHQDDKVDDGTHASVYTVSRRLLYSDFGSPVRRILRRSDLVKGYIKGFNSFVKDISSVFYATAANQERHMFSEVMKEVGIGVSEATKRAAGQASNTLRNSELLVGGAAVGFLFTGIIPKFKSDIEMRDSVKERRERFKRIKEKKWNVTTSRVSPESELRAAYKEHSPIGSPVSLTAINPNKIIQLGRHVYESLEGLLSTFSRKAKSALEIFTKSDRNVVLRDPDIVRETGQIVSSPTKAKDIVISAANKASRELSNIPQKLKEARKQAVDSVKSEMNLKEAGRRMEDYSLSATVERARKRVLDITYPEKHSTAIPKSRKPTYTPAARERKGVSHVRAFYRQDASRFDIKEMPNYRRDSRYYHVNTSTRRFPRFKDGKTNMQELMLTSGIAIPDATFYRGKNSTQVAHMFGSTATREPLRKHTDHSPMTRELNQQSIEYASPRTKYYDPKLSRQLLQRSNISSNRNHYYSNGSKSLSSMETIIQEGYLS